MKHIVVLSFGHLGDDCFLSFGIKQPNFLSLETLNIWYLIYWRVPKGLWKSTMILLSFIIMETTPTFHGCFEA
jgi:hypothetical protein